MARILNQFAHIFIHYYSNRTASACKLFISEPTQIQENALGRIFGILEINTPSRENTQLINHLITNLENTYYSRAENDNIDIEQCFEDSLKEVNQDFIALIRNKQISLVGNLNENTIREKINLCVGIMKNNQIHVSYLNNINLFLIHKAKQDYKIIDIKKIAQEENNDPTQAENINLFSNLLSGEVNPPDYLVLANSSFLEYISLERLQKIVTSLPLHKATEYFKNSLLQFEGQNFAAILIKNSFNETDLHNAPASLTSITELNSTESKTEKLLAPSLWNIIKNIKDVIYKNLKRFDKPKVTAEDKQEPDSETEQISPEKEMEAEPTKNKPAATFVDFLTRIKKSLRNFSQNNKILNNLKNKFNLKLNILRNKFTTVPNLSKILLIIAGILLILFIFSIFYFKQQQKQTTDETEYQALVSQIEEKKNQAESDIIYGNQDKAKDEITEAQNLLAKLPVDSKKQKEIQEGLNQDIWEIIAKLRNITIIQEPLLITDLSSQQETEINVENIVSKNNTILAFDSINNTNFQINLADNSVQLHTSNLADIGTIVRVKQINDKILAYHNKNGYVEYTNNNYNPINIAVAANAKIVDFAAYNSRLYTLDTNNNQIYRQPQADGGYSLGLTWLKQQQDLKDIVAMAIDVNIWLLDQKGLILKFTKGNQQIFEIKDLEPVLENPTRLFTDDQTNFIYILEPKNKRIIVIDKTGKLIAQYYSDQFNNLKDFIVNEKDNKIIIVNDNKIYSFPIKHL